MQGFGLIPVGMAPFGLGTPDPSGTPLAGTSGSRYLDTTTGDYVIDAATRQFKQMPKVKQRVLLALVTEQGTAKLLTDLGRRTPAKLGDSTQNEMQTMVAHALAQLIEIERIVELGQVLVERTPGGRAVVTIPYVDLTTGAEDSLRLAP